MPDLRDYPRVRVHVRVQCAPLDPRSIAPPLVGTTRDLSARGLAVGIPGLSPTETLLAEGSDVLVQFSLPEISKLFAIPCRVVWTWRPPPTGMGVEFLTVSDRDRTLIAEFIERFGLNR